MPEVERNDKPISLAISPTGALPTFKYLDIANRLLFAKAFKIFHIAVFIVYFSKIIP